MGVDLLLVLAPIQCGVSLKFFTYTDWQTLLNLSNVLASSISRSLLLQSTID
jgi:hypothetical protein